MKSGVLEESALTEPVQRGVRLVALSLIDEVSEAGEKLIGLAKELRDGDTTAEEALHDFRVAIRRLRSWLRGFRPWLGADISKKRLRRLAKIADSTRVSRDATVHLEWLVKQRTSLSARQRVGQSWLKERLSKEREEGAGDALAAADEFASLAPKLTKRLNFYRAPLREPENGELFGRIIAERIDAEASRLRRRLNAIERFTDAEPSHRARIAAKNLRYLIQPVAGFGAEGEAIIETLKQLQDSLGDVHDVHMFAGELAGATEKAAGARARRVSEVVMADDADGESEDDRIRRARAHDPGPGLLGLARQLHERGMQAYADVERDWLNDAGADFFERVHKFAKELGSTASRGTEIERKYLLTRTPSVVSDAPSVEIEQGYLPGERVLERIRHVRFADGGEKWFRTVKSGDGVKRVEFDDETEARLARAMWDLTTHRLRKRRYSIRESDDLTWEIDEFLDRDLVLAEIELPTPDTKVEIPAWLEDVLDREVTDDLEYTNARIAHSGVGSQPALGKTVEETFPEKTATTREAREGARI